MQDALGRVGGFVIVFLKQDTPNIVWSNGRQVLLFSIKNGRKLLNLTFVVRMVVNFDKLAINVLENFRFLEGFFKIMREF